MIVHTQSPFSQSEFAVVNMIVELGLVLIFMCSTPFIECQIEPFMVGGRVPDMKYFPYSVFMYIKCFEEDSEKSFTWICGASIVNEMIMLTAAHCIYGCARRSTFTVSVGHVHKEKGFGATIHTFYIHHKYSDSHTSYDIALTRTKRPLRFGKFVQRIAFMEDPPYFDEAQVAGWGSLTVSTFVYLFKIN